MMCTLLEFFYKDDFISVRVDSSTKIAHIQTIVCEKWTSFQTKKKKKKT